MLLLLPLLLPLLLLLPPLSLFVAAAVIAAGGGGNSVSECITWRHRLHLRCRLVELYRGTSRPAVPQPPSLSPLEVSTYSKLDPDVVSDAAVALGVRAALGTAGPAVSTHLAPAAVAEGSREAARAREDAKIKALRCVQLLSC